MVTRSGGSGISGKTVTVECWIWTYVDATGARRMTPEPMTADEAAKLMDPARMPGTSTFKEVPYKPQGPKP
jgi:hypothetical protein